MTATVTERTVTLMRLAPEEEEAIHQMRADERVAKRCQIAAAHTDTCMSTGPLQEQLVHTAIVAALKEQEEHIRNSPIYHDIILDGVGLCPDLDGDPPRPQGDRVAAAAPGPEGKPLLHYLLALASALANPEHTWGDHKIALGENVSKFEMDYLVDGANVRVEIGMPKSAETAATAAPGLPRPGDDDTCAPPPADCAQEDAGYQGCFSPRTDDEEQHPIIHEVARKRGAYIQALARANQSANEYDAKHARMKNASHAADADNKDADAARHEYFNALDEAVKQGQGPNIG